MPWQSEQRQRGYVGQLAIDIGCRADVSNLEVAIPIDRLSDRLGDY